MGRALFETGAANLEYAPGPASQQVDGGTTVHCPMNGDRRPIKFHRQILPAVQRMTIDASQILPK
jgi:hypothetical protein